jgi:hypothetical protein
VHQSPLCLLEKNPCINQKKKTGSNSEYIFGKNDCFPVDNKYIKEPYATAFINKKTFPKNNYYYHLGVLVFAPLFKKLKKRGLDIFLQWFIAVLLGAKNIEQTKRISYSSLSKIIDTPIISPKEQRRTLKQLANQTNINRLLSFNMEIVGVENHTDYYYDPHTKHYTGLRKILKGWCSKIGLPGKIINMDFIHTSTGYPVYVGVDDNYDDMRIRFFRQVEELRRLGNFAEDKTLTYIVDRGIFSAEVFNKVLEMNNLHLITWEKDYKHDRWDDQEKISQGILQRYRNDKNHTIDVDYSFQDKRWPQQDKLRQVIVRLSQGKDKNKKTIEVSILTDDLQRTGHQIVQLMFNRWIQENDFKYLIEHFGIDQITSYDYFAYKEIQDQLQDKEYTSGQYLAADKELQQIKGKLKTYLYKLQLLKMRKKGRKYTEKEKERKKNLEKQIAELSNRHTLKEEQRNEIKKYVSKIEELINQQTCKLRMDIKRMMDILKITARNIFYLTFEPFREQYNDFRDDWMICRELSRAHGILQINEDGSITIKLIPVMELTPKMIRVFKNLIENINRQNIEMPNLASTKISLELNKNINSFLAFESPEK